MEEQPKQVLYTEKDFPSFCTWKSLRTNQAFTITDVDFTLCDLKKESHTYPYAWLSGVAIIRSYHDGEKFFALKFNFLPKHRPSFFTHALTLGDFSSDDAVRLHAICTARISALKETIG